MYSIFGPFMLFVFITDFDLTYFKRHPSAAGNSKLKRHKSLSAGHNIGLSEVKLNVVQQISGKLWHYVFWGNGYCFYLYVCVKYTSTLYLLFRH